MATSVQGAFILTRKTKHRHEKVIKIYTCSIQGERMGVQQPGVQRAKKHGEEQRLSRISSEFVKEDFQSKFGAESKKRDFSSVGL